MATAPIQFSIIIVSLNGEPRIRECLDAVQKSLGLWANRTETIVVDNGSTDQLSAVVREEYPWARLLRAERNLGFAGGNNLGIRASKGSIVILLNDDAFPELGWLDHLDQAAKDNPKWGALGCLLMYPESDAETSGLVQHAGGILERNGLSKHIGWGDLRSKWEHAGYFECPYVTGAAIALNRQALRRVGLLDPDFFPIYFEETELCIRLWRAGYRIIMQPRAVVLHNESQVTQVRSQGFYTKYHACRYRFLLITTLAKDFPATIWGEIKWMIPHLIPTHVVPVAKAVWWNLLRWRKTRAARRRHFRIARRALTS